MPICAPHETLEAKRSFSIVPVGFDWHDYLALTWGAGRSVQSGEKVRLKRSRSRGLQFRCSIAGVTGSREPVWPIADGGIVTDGSVEWTAEPVAADSLRTTITGSNWIDVSGALTLDSPHDADLRYLIQVGGGFSGQVYEIRQQVTFANGEQDEGVAFLPVID